MANSPGKNPYSLSIRIFTDGFSFYIHDENRELLSVKHLRTGTTDRQEDFAELLAQSELKSSFNKTRVIVETGFYTLIPEHFSTDSRALLTLQHPYLNEDSPIITNNIDGQGMTVVFAPGAGLLKALRSVFPEIVPQHHLNTFLRIPPESGRVIVWTRGNEIDLMLFDQGKCLLMNSFNITTTEDIIYYTLNLYREFGLNRHEFALRVFSPESSAQGIGNQSDITDGLKTFFGNFKVKLQTTCYEDYQW
jgi:hypothetical protein